MSAQETPVPTIWTTGWTTVFDTGTWRSQLPVHTWRPAPCFVSCPLGNEIPLWIRSITGGSEEDYKAAWEKVVENDPFPAVIGRVCHHPCETECNRQALEQSVAINSLEQYLGDLALEKGWTLPPAGAAQGKKVAVVGGGPAGLSCAYQLRRFGYDVTIYEARDAVGGLLKFGIPEYRLPQAVTDAEVKRVLDMGIEVKTGEAIDTGEKLEALRSSYDAVFLAVGAQKAKRLPYLGDDARILIGLDFLEAVRRGQTPTLGDKVAVIGGGSAAMDVARTLRRLGKAVQLIALEGRNELPAQEEEVVEALEEGVSLFDGAMVASLDTSKPLMELSCKKVVLDKEALAKGEIKPIPLEGSDFKLEAHQVIVTIGQDPALDGLEKAVAVESGMIKTNGGPAASLPGVFAGGDVATMDRYVSRAIGQGKEAARAIAAYLGHPEIAPLPAYTLDDAVARNEINPFYFPIAPREEREHTAVAERLGSFADVKIGYREGQALAEADRCMSCGTCVECDNCYVFCPDMAVKKAPEKEEYYAVLEQYCKGCGLCAAECPRGCIIMKQESK
ncbi:MAG: FAD-dependent oxidoreductase [Actinobacteria bacterium]|nr:FAD-dependent oxidoreductase [Actinomycetota bacterium]